MSQLSSAFVQTLILQLDPQKPLFNTNYPWVTTSVAATTEDAKSTEDEFSGLPSHSTEGTNESVDKFLSGSINAILFNFEAPEQAVARIAFSRGSTVAQLKEFVSPILGIRFDPLTDSFLLYKGDTADPSQQFTAISSTLSGEIAYQFSQKKLYRVYARHVPSVLESRLTSLTDQSITFSEDGYSITRSTRLYLPHYSKISEVRRQLIERHVIPDSPQLRFAIVYLSNIEQIVTDLDISLSYYQILRIDIIPEDQRDSAAMIIPVGFMKHNTYLTGIGNPFFFALRMEEKLQDLRNRLRTALKMEEDEFKKWQIFVTNDSRPTYTSSGVFLKGDKPIGELLESITHAGLRLFLVRGAARGRHGQDQPVKIYN
jgi:hypothetical protein